jgi:hypothetical protein
MTDRSPRAPATSHLEVLALRIHGLESPFACGGTVLAREPIALRFPDRKTIAIVGDGVAAELAQRCRPARFGHGHATRRDPRVREGLQLGAAGGAFTVTGLDLTTSGILGKIHRELCPGDPRPPTAELYALNVYEAGGHFVTHKDTPLDADLLGTLVVCLPVRFSGGRLVVRHGAARVFDWAKQIDAQRAPHRVHWAAFFGDVDHEIERVTYGSRVTLTWALRRGAGAIDRRTQPAVLDEDDRIDQAFAAALADPHFLPHGGMLGLPCTHLYAETPGLTRPATALGPTTARRLKGRDQRFAAAAIRAGLTTRYRPYLFESDIEERWRLSRLPTQNETSMFRDTQIDSDEIEETMPIEHHATWDQGKEDVTWILPPPWTERHASRSDTAIELLGEPEYSTTGYFGNEGSPAAFYVFASLLVTVPPASRRTPRPTAKPRGAAAKPRSAAAKPRRTAARSRGTAAKATLRSAGPRRAR